MRSQWVLVVICAITTILIGFGAGEISFTDERIFEWKPPGNMSSKYPYYHVGFDHEGTAIWIPDIAKWSIEKFQQISDKDLENLRTYVNQMAARIIRSGKEKDANGWAIIIDTNVRFSLLGQTKLIHESIRATRLFLLLTPDDYPRYIILVNTGIFAKTMTELAKPILGEFANNVYVYGTNPGMWKPQLLKRIPSSQLPKFLGGSEDHKHVQAFG